MKLFSRNVILAAAVVTAALTGAARVRAQEHASSPTPNVETATTPVAAGETPSATTAGGEAHGTPAEGVSAGEPAPATDGHAPPAAGAHGEAGHAGAEHQGAERGAGEHPGGEHAEHTEHTDPETGPFGHVCIGAGNCDFRKGEGETSVNVIHHVSDGRELEFPLLPFLGHIHLPSWLTKVRVWMVICSLTLIFLFTIARKGMGLVPKGLYNLLESFVLFVRDEIAIKNIGEHHGREYTPYLLTVFFFILTCNFMGLLPGGVTVTANINVTAMLAIMTLVMTQIGGMKQYGVVHHFKNLVPPGMPVWLLPIMIPVEIMGVFSKPFALAVRLFANMTAGHVIILSLLALIFQFGYFFAPVSIGFSLFIFLLELLVAFLQAYIFTMLTALFIGMSVHVSH